MIRVFLADDHPAFRAGVRVVLEEFGGFDVVGEAEGGREALEGVEQTNPDVLLLDMELPDVRGLEVAKILTEKKSPVRILPLSGYSDTEQVLGILEAGASGYMTKDEPIGMLAEAIRQVAKGGVYVSPRLAVEIVQSRRRKFRDDLRRRDISMELCRLGLTPRHVRVLKFVAEGLTNADIAKREFRSEYTARNLVDQLYSLLQINWRPALVAWAWRNGVVDIEDDRFVAYHERYVETQVRTGGK